MSSGYLQLATKGAQDVYLTDNPQITFFKSVYRRHIPFSRDTRPLRKIGEAGPGKEIVVEIDNIGDLLSGVYIQLKIPTLNPDTADFINYCKAYSFIESAQCYIGDQLIDSITPEIHQARSFYKGKVGQSNDNSPTYDFGDPLILMMGGYYEYNKTLWIPLQFWFSESLGQAFPLIALQYKKLSIRIKFAAQNVTESTIQPIDELFYTNNDVEVWGNFIYLDPDQKKKYAEKEHQYLINQHQRMVVTDEFTNGQDYKIRLNFLHPCSYIAWCLLGAGNKNLPTTNEGTDSNFGFSKANFMVDGKPIVDDKSIGYYHYYQVYNNFGTLVNPLPTFIYGFTLNGSDSVQPAGTLNFSRINNAHLIVTPTVTGARTIVVWAENYNVLRIASGQAGIAYVN
jgi:hypothetical protein